MSLSASIALARKLVAPAVFLTISLLFFSAQASSPAVVTYEGVAPTFGGPFALVDQSGRIRRDTDFRGKLMMIYFGDTHCTDVCPLELQKMSGVIDLLGPKASDVQPVFITGDPHRDTVKRLKEYFSKFPPQFVALTGSDQQISDVMREFQVDFDRVEKAGGDYDFDHTSLIFLMDRQGHHIEHFGTSFSAEEIAKAIEEHL